MFLSLLTSFPGLTVRAPYNQQYCLYVQVPCMLCYSLYACIFKL